MLFLGLEYRLFVFSSDTISLKVLIKSLERKRNEHQEAYDAFVSSAGKQGNVIYGVKVSTSVGQFKNGSFLYITYYGTVATVECTS